MRDRKWNRADRVLPIVGKDGRSRPILVFYSKDHDYCPLESRLLITRLNVDFKKTWWGGYEVRKHDLWMELPKTG